MELFLSTAPTPLGLEFGGAHVGAPRPLPGETKVQPTFFWGNVLWARKIWVGAMRLRTLFQSGDFLGS